MMYTEKGDNMIVQFGALREYDFALSGINVIYQKPIYRALHMKSRLCNGFLYITHGECRYSSHDGEINLKPDSVVYLPLGSKHELTVTSKNIEFYRIDFMVHIKEEFTRFSDGPLLITDSASMQCREAVRMLDEVCKYEKNSIEKNGKLCTLFSLLQDHSSNARKSKIEPAVHHIHDHLTECINCRELASMCFLSTAQFYNLFHEEYKISPLEYRNKLLMRRAEILLGSGEVSVTETADMLGFSSIAYFSRFFKKNKGISPLEYIKNNCTI